MKKSKLFILSLSVLAGLSFLVPLENVHAAEIENSSTTLATNQIWATRTVPYTTKSSMWVSQTRNGTLYEGYIYNRGFSDGTGNYSFFSGYLRASGPYVPQSLKLDEK